MAVRSSRAPVATRPPVWTVISAASALVGLLGGWVTAELLEPRGYDPVRMTISALAKHGAHNRWLMTAGLLLIGIGHLGTAAGLTSLRMPARILLALGGVAGVGVAACAQPAQGSSNAHLAFAVLGVVVLALFPVAVFRREATTFPLRRVDIAVSGCLSLALVAWLIAAVNGGMLGVAERAITFQQTLWPLLVVVALRRELRVPAASVRSREVATIAL